MGLDAGVGQGGVFVATERKDGLVHVGGVKDAEVDEEMEFLDGQTGDGSEESWFELGSAEALVESKTASI